MTKPFKSISFDLDELLEIQAGLESVKTCSYSLIGIGEEIAFNVSSIETCDKALRKVRRAINKLFDSGCVPKFSNRADRQAPI